jgi:hypothetical protein
MRSPVSAASKRNARTVRVHMRIVCSSGGVLMSLLDNMDDLHAGGRYFWLKPRTPHRLG